jgi:hypothetical protein
MYILTFESSNRAAVIIGIYAIPAPPFRRRRELYKQQKSISSLYIGLLIPKLYIGDIG